MKKIRVLLIAVLLLSAGSSFQQIFGQEKTKEEQERDQKIQQAIDEQKKVMAEQKRAQADAEMEYREQHVKLEELMNDIRVTRESSAGSGDAVRIYTPRLNRTFSGADPFIFSGEGDSWYLHSIGESERTTWDFSRSVKETTFSKGYTFDVEKSAKSVVMSVMGDCKAGEIRVKITMPNGKNYSDIVIDEFGNLNWRKSFSISETENLDKTGEWKFQVTSNKATGYFKISIQSN